MFLVDLVIMLLIFGVREVMFKRSWALRLEVGFQVFLLVFAGDLYNLFVFLKSDI
jgi:hypothetical protein